MQTLRRCLGIGLNSPNLAVERPAGSQLLTASDSASGQVIGSGAPQVGRGSLTPSKEPSTIGHNPVSVSQSQTPVFLCIRL
jgi:hypothetical protein